MRQLSYQEKQQLHDVLLRIRGMHDQEQRSLYIQELESQLGHGLPLARYPDAHHDVWSLLDACRDYTGALRCLALIVRDFQGRSDPVVELFRLVDELEPAWLLEGAERTPLARLLAGVAQEQLVEVYRATVPPASQVRAAWSEPTTMIFHLESLQSPSTGPPLLLEYVDQVGHGVSGSARLAIHQWINDVGRRMGHAEDDLRRLCVRSTGTETRKSAESGTALPQDKDSARDPADDDDREPRSGADDVTSTLHVRPATDGAEMDLLVNETRSIRGGIPPRNPHFIGRQPLLRELRHSLTSQLKAAVLPQTLHGLGGVGKTQLAVEYVYEFDEYYDLVWWISAEHGSIVRNSLALLGNRLGLPSSEDMQQTATAVLNALATSRMRWLLVYDNADQPDDLAGLTPSSGGHVIITSRNQAWAIQGNAIEVDVFERQESLELLRRRSPTIADTEAKLLAEKLGDLPLALEQASTWQASTGMSVSEYLNLFDAHVRELLSEGKPASYPMPVTASFGMAFDRLRTESPSASQLLELFIYLGPEPVSVSLLRSGRTTALSAPLKEAVSESIAMGRAIRQLRRFALAKVDPDGQKIQVHRLVQAMLREAVTDEQREQSRLNVHRILAAANPTEPDDQRTWQGHQEINPHVVPSELVSSELDEARRTVLDQIRYLYAKGDYEGSRALGELATRVWQDSMGEDDEVTLLATRHLANTLRDLGETERAYNLDEQTLNRLRQHPDFGPDHEHTLNAANGYGSDLRIRGQYAEALANDEDNLARHRQLFLEEDDPNTLRTKNNLAVDYRLLGDFGRALKLGQEIVALRRSTGEINRLLLDSIRSVTFDLYALGRYREALEQLDQIEPMQIEQLGSNHRDVLLTSRTVAAVLRKLGRYRDAVRRARENYRAFHTRFGPDHEHTLAATMSYANALRAVEDLSEARSIATEATNRYGRRFGDEHPFTLAAMVNLSIILRASGERKEARRMDESAYEAMIRRLGEKHPYALCVANNLSNDLASFHELGQARELSEETLVRSRKIRGDLHPYTLACAVNVALDRKDSGDEEDGQKLFDETQQKMKTVLGSEHPETVDAGRGKRAECDIEPPPT